MAMRIQSSSHKKPVNIGRIIKTPIRAVSKALNLYVKGITNLTTNRNRPKRNNEITTLESQHLPRSFSTSRTLVSNYEEPPESALVRSISAAPSGSRSTRINYSVELENYMMQQRRNKLQSYAASKDHVPRSCSVGMGKIDEDRASSFRNDNILKSKIDVKVKRSMFSSFRKS